MDSACGSVCAGGVDVGVCLLVGVGISAPVDVCLHVCAGVCAGERVCGLCGWQVLTLLSLGRGRPRMFAVSVY